MKKRHDRVGEIHESSSSEMFLRECSSSSTGQEEAEAAYEESDLTWMPPVMLGVGWKARGDRQPTDKRVPFNRPTTKQVIEALPFVRRYFVYWMRHTFDKEKLFINTFQPLKHKPYYGVPCGGLGCGAIGRDFRGGFCKFSLRPGLVEHKVNVVPADQFILSVRENGKCIYQKVLCAADVASGPLSSWDFTFPKKDVFYRGLFPRSWTCYRVKEVGLIVLIRQVSPVIPNDYESSSLPVTNFIVQVLNQTPSRPLEVTIAFTFRNGTGNKRWERESRCESAKFVANGADDKPVTGVILCHKISQMDCAYGLATVRSEGTSICQRFDPSGSGEAVWDCLEKTGDLPHYEESCEQDSREMGVAVANRFEVLPGNSESCEFSLSWDMPTVLFGSSGRSYRRRYTRFFGAGNVADALCARALRRRSNWEKDLDDWQSPTINHLFLPSWYKSALFNELYFITDGGTVWFEFDEEWRSHETHLESYTANLMKEVGRFGYLESWEYRMVNTYDVHFYASYALAELWPKLELAVQAEFTDQVYHTVDTQIRFHMEGDVANLKTASRVPHDLGNPADDPWLATNAYVMHDTGKWKDLNMKYVLTTWRDYVALSVDRQKFLEHTWPAVKKIMTEALATWDQDGDGMIENFGKADQTYDAWQMEGVSAYCGSLWLGSLRAAAEMAEKSEDSETAKLFLETLKKAKKVFVEKLWTGKYFRFCERSRSKDTVMADQLCGYWFLHSVSPELARDILPEHMVKSAMETIYELNVCRFAGGTMGAVNGMKSNGKVDREYIQADEMWTGVTYAVSALLLQHGRYAEGFHTASGCYKTCFERTGLQYQTPEAMYETKFYRAIGYMRPLSIWSMQWALKRHSSIFTPEDELLAIGRRLKGDSRLDQTDELPSPRNFPVLDERVGAISEDSGSLGYVSDFKEETVTEVT